MAERRMFAKTIIDSDSFLDMPLSTQALYFHLSMRADDDGFINNPKKLCRMIGSSDDEMKVLFAKKFLLGFESGVIVIKHWKMHNYIQKDRYKETNYLDEKSQLREKDNKVYTLDTQCIQVGDTGKDRLELGKVSIGKKKEIFEYPEWLDLISWNEWLIYRKEIKKKLTPSMIKKQIDFLSRNINFHTDIINQSIQNGWTGLFELKQNQQQQKIYAPVKGMTASEVRDAMAEEAERGLQNTISE